jgi:protein tyrosine kinase modulator
MMAGNVFSLDPYLDVVWRHRVAALSAIFVGFALTGLAAVMAPRTYVSSVTLELNPSQVPTQYATPSAQEIDFKTRVQQIQQEVLSSRSLSGIIGEFALYPNYRAHHQPLSKIAKRMREYVEVTVTADDESRYAHGGSIRIAYGYSAPVAAKGVVARLGELFVGQDLAREKKQARAAVDFLDNQLVEREKELDTKTAEIRAFKDEFQGSLPENLDVNLKTLGSLQSDLGSATEAFSNAEQRQMELDQRLATAEQPNVSFRSAAGQANWTSPQAALTSLQTQLAVLRAQYRDDYPDVVHLKAEIAVLMKKFNPAAPGTSGATDDQSPLDQELRRQRSAMGAESSRLNSQINTLRARIDIYNERIRITPIHEQQLAVLTRDYTVLTDHYHQLLEKKLSAQGFEDLVDQGEGERLQVIEPAVLSDSPSFPKTAVLLGVGIVLSLAIALGLPFALYFMDTSFKELDELSGHEIPVAAVIPEMPELHGHITQLARWRRTLVISSASLSAGVAILWVWAARIL